jgi:excinuclease ABC subunit C
VMMPFLPDDSGILTKWMKSIRKKNVELFVPQLGDKKKFVNMASINAEFQLKEYHLAISKREQTVPHVLKSMQRDLRMKNPPIRIECFDNSHIQGTELVSSCVVFENGRPKKSDYRKFISRTVEGNDDFAAMKEVVSRRYTRLIKEKAQLPDLIIIDGGKGQLSQAVDILNELGISDKILVVGLAKRLDEIFFPGESESLVLPRASSSLMLIQHLRDEAHRFAISFHRQLRDKRTLQTELTEIPGVGEKTAKKLLIEFGSVENVKKTSFEELSKIVNARISKAVIEFYEGGKD